MSMCSSKTFGIVYHLTLLIHLLSTHSKTDKTTLIQSSIMLKHLTLEAASRLELYMFL